MNPLEQRVQELEETIKRILRCEDIAFIKAIERNTDFVTSEELQALQLSDLSDVASTTPSSGQVLEWNGTEWAPATDNVGP